jgi:hypothetical protein
MTNRLAKGPIPIKNKMYMRVRDLLTDRGISELCLMLWLTSNLMTSEGLAEAGIALGNWLGEPTAPK